MTQSKLASAEVRTSIRLAKQPQRDTKPELAVRRVLRMLGIGYRLRNQDLPGTPDIANRTHRWVIFVNGCFWHHHEGCSRATVPKHNREGWLAKFMANRDRDCRVQVALESMGYLVVNIWECEALDPEGLLERVRELEPALN